MGLHFSAFLKRVRVRPATVARKTGLDISTVTRIRDGQVPKGPTMLRLNHWASEVADALELRPHERLSWDHLLERRDGASGGGA